MISQTESVIHLCLAAGASTAMFGAGLLRRRERGRRWTWIVGGVVGAMMTAYVADAELRGYSDPNAAIPLALAALAGVVVGAFLLRVGLRGQRVGDHEYCRRCGFDLFGRPPGTRVCGECGTSLDAPRAIVVGVRQRRPVPLLAGCFALVLSLALSVPLGRDGVAWARRYDWRERWWPESWLLAELKSPTQAVRVRAADHLSTREWNGRLSAAGRAALFDALFSPSFSAQAMSDGLSAFRLATIAWEAGRLDEASMRRVMRAALDLHRLDVAPAAARSRMLRHYLDAPDWASASSDVLRCVLTDRRDVIGGRSLGPAKRSTLVQTAERNTTWGRPADNALQLPADLPLGPATLTTRLTATMTLAVPGRPTIVEPDDMRCPPATMPANFLPDVTLDREDPAHVSLRVGLPWSAGGVAILADVALRPRGGAERALGPVYADANVQASIDLGPLPPGFYDVILRPRPDLGAELFEPVPIVADEMLVPVPGER